MIQGTVWQARIELAVAASKNGQPELGEKMLSAAMSDAGEAGSEIFSIARALNDLAYGYYQRGKYRRAQETLRHGLALCERTLGSANKQVAGMMLNLAELYFSRGKEREARVLFERFVAITESLSGPDDPALERPLTKLAWINSRRSRFALAHTQYLRALKIRARSQPMSQAVFQPASGSMSQAVSMPASGSLTQPVSLPTSGSLTQPVSPPASLSLSQPALPPMSEPSG